MMIIGITGPISAGKGKVAEFFRDRGFTHHSFSAEIREVAKERGIEISRATLSKLGYDLRKESKESLLATRILSMIAKDTKKGKNNFVVEGIRDPDEINMFREHELENPSMLFILIGVNADQKTRFVRMRSRGRQGDPKTFAEFKKIDDKEIKGGGGQEVEKCLKMADYLIQNDGTLPELEDKVEEIAKEIM